MSKITENNLYKRGGNEPSPTPEIETANKLAAQFSKIDGWEVPVGYRFDLSEHPRASKYWQMTVAAMIELTGIDPEDSLLMPFQLKQKHKLWK